MQGVRKACTKTLDVFGWLLDAAGQPGNHDKGTETLEWTESGTGQGYVTLHLQGPGCQEAGRRCWEAG